MTIKDNLQALQKIDIKDRNLVNHYLTFRQQRSDKPALPDYMSIAGSLLSMAWSKKLDSDAGLAKYIEKCSSRLSEKIRDADFDRLLSQMYFTEDAKGLYQIAPDFLLFKAEESTVGNTKHISNVLGSILMNSDMPISRLSQEVNFLESELLDELQNHIVDLESSTQTADYLPFLSEVFVKDLAFLSQNPSYMMQSFKGFITLYNFLYSAQLANNIRAWHEEPCSKPLYFILDTERASIERTRVREAVAALLGNVEYLFPVLSALEYFNQPDSTKSSQYPLWMHFEYIQSLPELEQTKLVSDLSEFLVRYREKRGIKSWQDPINSVQDAFDAVVKTAREIFTQARSSQLTVNRKVVSSFENEVARHFIQNRNRGGRVLILNQDYLLLLTNLAIGDVQEGKLPLQILLEEFKSRGVWLDQQSQQALIEFYERVGNLERMSDSGDAVYVRKTI